MTTTYYAAGDRLHWTNDTGSAVVSGEAVEVADLFGVAGTDIADGADGALEISGVHHLPLTAGAAFAQGTAVGWDATNNTVVTGGTMGYVYSAVDAAATSIPVLINR